MTGAGSYGSRSPERFYMIALPQSASNGALVSPLNFNSLNDTADQSSDLEFEIPTLANVADPKPR
jgi:hypothetical protein